MVYGGRKNCSSTTYMPRIISVRRKYLPALSREDSLLSSQRSFRGSRKPWGGGPAGVAARREVLLKVADGIVVRVARKAVSRVEVGRVRVSIVRERAEAMVMAVKKEVVAKCEVVGMKMTGCNERMALRIGIDVKVSEL